MDVKHIPMAWQIKVWTMPAGLIRWPHSIRLFDIVLTAPNQAQIVDAIDRDQAKLRLSSREFTEHIIGMTPAFFIVDDSDPFTTQSAYNAANLIAQQHHSAGVE
jgi:hypothetical protein